MNNYFLRKGILLLLMILPVESYSTEAAFIQLEQTPNSLAILPPPPAYNSVAFLYDQAQFYQGKALRGTSRDKQAAIDADLSEGNLGNLFSEALGVELSPKKTPATYNLLKKIDNSGGYATNSAKQYYMRIRPFALFNDSTCAPKDEGFLRKNGSYPSGHTTFGWAAALILAEIRPERQNEILKRGYEYGQSRVICGAHWQSDVDAGRIVGAALVARLHADSGFTTQLEQAKTEIKKITGGK